MPLFITFGINGCGKDTLSKELLKTHAEIKLLSGSRIMLKGLGFDVGITVDSPATKAMYDTLEQTPEITKQKMADEFFKSTLLEFKQTGEIGIISSHLIIARRDETTINYESGLIRDWFGEVFDGFIYIKGDPREIFNRQIKDKSADIRDRGLSSIESLARQQVLSNLEWEKLKLVVPESKMKTIYNLDGSLELSASKLESFIKLQLQENKESTNELRSQFKPR